MANNKTVLDPNDTRHSIFIKGARSNNLQNIDVVIPKKKIVIVTGVSGSGKSSLIMDTLYAEGQRRYVESLSSYARQFLLRMKKPDVDYIKGICPAIAIEQKVSTSNARSTVGSMTEVYDFMRLLYARIGKTISPVSGLQVKRHEVGDVIDYIKSLIKGTRIYLLIPVSTKYSDRSFSQELSILLQKGYTRILRHEELFQIEDILKAKGWPLKDKLSKLHPNEFYVLIDRFAVDKDDEDLVNRITDSVSTAFAEGEGNATVYILDQKKYYHYNNRFEADGISFLEPTPHLFNYNNPYGACPRCEGYGRVMGIDHDKVIPDKSKSVYEGAIACWSGEKGGLWLQELINKSDQFNFPIHKPINKLTKEQYNILWSGNDYFYGISAYFKELEEKTYKIQNRVMLARFRGRTICPECNGGRLRKESSFVKISGTALSDLIHLPIDELLEHFQNLKFNKNDQTIASRILREVYQRLEIMCKLGLKHLTLERLGSTLSGGETQRINLTRTLGSNLTSSLYILDEPSVGLHPVDSNKLLEVLKELRNLGNTVVVVEHEEEIIRHADHIIDIGPYAGIHGGRVVFTGTYNDFNKTDTPGLTAEYLQGEKRIEIPAWRRKWNNKLIIKGAHLHNLQNLTVTFPLNTITVITGVSGSGKTSLVKNLLYPAIEQAISEGQYSHIAGMESLTGDINRIKLVEMINQNPIGKSSRSNPVTYVKAYDAIRKLFSNQSLAKVRGYGPGHFSFNVEGGRCETCQGEGEITVEMQFLADVKLLCEDCKGKRFKAEVLEVKFKEKNLFDILDMSIEESLVFFKDQHDIYSKLKPLNDVGLGYVKLGQPSSTLSGGEAQRVKLASYLTKEAGQESILFIFDEPTTGLHFHDIKKLLDSFNALVENGHSVILIEHNMDVIKSADWVIDLGPGGGKEGGNLIFAGIPEDLAKTKESLTGQFLKEKLALN
ncbi:MAG: excinuclease ABC subunit UvrA [Saprospiraceae bacterium]